jgi:hypothetical protein
MSGELSKDSNVDDYTWYLSSILAGLFIQAANGSSLEAKVKRELTETAFIVVAAGSQSTESTF